MSTENIILSALCLTILLPCVLATGQACQLSVSPNRRYLLKEGKPFLWPAPPTAGFSSSTCHAATS